MSEESPRKKSGFGCVLWSCGGCLFFFLGFISLIVIIGLIFHTDSLDMDDDETIDIESKIVPGYNRGSTNCIAMIPVHGVIMYGDSQTSNIVTPDIFSAMMDKAEKDDKVCAVILSIDSPGGEVNAADAIYRRILTYRKNTNRPVIALMRTVAASGGYYVAAGCDKIIARDLTITGSIGVIISTYNFTGLLKKIGVEGEVYKSGAMKDMLSPTKARTPEEAAIVQELVNDSYLNFAKIVAESRKLPLEKVTKGPIGDGRVYHGRKALAYGMVDQLGALKEAVLLCEKMTKNREGSLSVKKYKHDPDLLDILMSAESPVRNGMKVRFDLPGKDTVSGLESGKLYYLPAGF